MPQPFLELNAEVTEQYLRKYGEQLRDGKLTLPRFAELARKQIVTAAASGFRFANGGPLTTRQTALLNNLLAEQARYFDRMVAGFGNGTIPLAHAPHRAAAYTGAATVAAGYGAISREGAADEYTWNGRGDDASCATCFERIGRRFKRDWLLGNGMPGQLTCLASCRCSLTPVEAVA